MGSIRRGICRSLRLLSCILAAFPVCAFSQNTSELRPAEGSRSAWLDLRPGTTTNSPQTVPAWIEALEFSQSHMGTPVAAEGGRDSGGRVAADTDTAPAFTIFRIRLRRPEATPGDLLLRLLFDDDASGARPTVSAWDELGNTRWRGTGPLGEGLGLATSQSITVPMNGVDYLEITVPGDGRGVRGAFLAWLETRKVQRVIDSAPQRAQLLRDPFGAAAPIAPRDADEHRFGVVTAVLQRDPVRLGGLAPVQAGGRPLPRAAEIEFELERPPLVALLNFEVLNATGGAAPKISVNGRDLGRVETALPDLADPGFRGQAREGGPELAWQYTGWVRAQKLVPASALNTGVNKLLVTLSEESDPAAVRSVEIQLKYYWEKFDYTLSPRSP